MCNREVIADYDYINNVIDYDYITSGNGDYYDDYLRSCNRLQTITITDYDYDAFATSLATEASWSIQHRYLI